MMPKQPVFGDILLAARRAQGVTQEGLCNRSGVSRAAIVKIESGANTSIETARALAEGLGFDLKIEFAPKVAVDPVDAIYGFKTFLDEVRAPSELMLGFRPAKR
jgi:transcriptional regulator with XRE-family HTH domain